MSSLIEIANNEQRNGTQQQQHENVSFCSNIYSRSEIFVDNIELSLVGEQTPDDGDGLGNDDHGNGAETGDGAGDTFEPSLAALELERLGRADHEQVEENGGIELEEEVDEEPGDGGSEKKEAGDAELSGQGYPVVEREAEPEAAEER